MDLLFEFTEFIRREKLFSPRDRLLAAVSGGLDSVVLCELLQRAGFDYIIAHCNFGLRGEESERDERFVRGLGVRYGREVLVKRFDTLAYAGNQRVSVQVAARELRYAWFAEVAPGPVVTAHHQDDNIETVLMNFFKGTGIAGLRGMLPRQGRVVRPLLSAGREAIRAFAVAEGLEWVEDSSNESDKYTRNYLRHRVIPLIEEVYPGAVHNLGANVGRFREIEEVYRKGIDQQLKWLQESRGNEVWVPVLKLKGVRPLATIVYEMIVPFGFSAQQVGAVVGLLDSGSGKYVCSATHRVLRDRAWLIISPLDTGTGASNILVEAKDEAIDYEGGRLVQRRMSVADLPADISDASVAWLDAREVVYPLLLRKWRTGDYFYPLGMRKKKKLSRLFIDARLPLTEKEKVWVVESNKKILWVVGMRIDDRCRIGAGTSEVVRIGWQPPARD
ncbi:tRNA lysidine(34) synthetase TilS [Puia sp. P3]|uniref:tRNA lysidine(34) synthetase TilS n=1 Tax=Puia sp. P3 TaxID=3423952 RepID=UPI003D67EA55